uniref:Halomucin n=1 Tax=Caenorhabditis tropicalis TaxID=1561998 RepID=A0A1I7UYJ9_9PELO
MTPARIAVKVTLKNPVTTCNSEPETPKRLAAGFCNCNKRMLISVSRCNGKSYNYVYDEDSNKFKPLTCVECQPAVTEKDLVPEYSVLHESKTVLFAYNRVSDKHEQFVYNPETGGLEQVNFSDLVYDSSRSNSSDILLTVNTENGLVVILKGKDDHLVKEISRNGSSEFVRMEMIEVKTLPVEKRTLTSDELTKVRPRFCIRFDKRSNKEVVFVLNNRKLLSVHWYNNVTGDFELTETNGCPTEYYIFPKSVTRKDDEYVIHAENGMTGAIEHFVYSLEKQRFEQVLFPDAVSSSETKSDILCIIDGSEGEGSVVITKDKTFGHIKKNQLNKATGQMEELPANNVIFFAMQDEEEDQLTGEYEALSPSSGAQTDDLDNGMQKSLADANLDAEQVDSSLTGFNSSLQNALDIASKQNEQKESEAVEEVMENVGSSNDGGYSSTASPRGRSVESLSPDSMVADRDEERTESDSSPNKTTFAYAHSQYSEDIDSDDSDIDMSMVESYEKYKGNLFNAQTEDNSDNKQDSSNVKSNAVNVDSDNISNGMNESPSTSQKEEEATEKGSGNSSNNPDPKEVSVAEPEEKVSENSGADDRQNSSMDSENSDIEVMDYSFPTTNDTNETNKDEFDENELPPQKFHVD